MDFVDTLSKPEIQERYKNHTGEFSISTGYYPKDSSGDFGTFEGKFVDGKPHGHVKAVSVWKPYEDFYKGSLVSSEPGSFNRVGSELYYENGKLHKDNEPAVISVLHFKRQDSNVDTFIERYWYKNGKLHREDGPAFEHFVIRRDGEGVKKEQIRDGWCFNGETHREDGPAEFNYENGKIKSKVWGVNGKKHREDGPAIERANGDEEWYLYGKLHRVDGPAYTYTPEKDYPDFDDGPVKEWWFNDEKHRENGPAVEYTKGRKEWWTHGKLYRIKRANGTIQVFDGVTDRDVPHDQGPVRRKNGDKEWWVEGKLHREDGPAIERINGDKLWYKDGRLHNNSGPAVISIDAPDEWYVDGKKIF